MTTLTGQRAALDTQVPNKIINQYSQAHRSVVRLNHYHMDKAQRLLSQIKQYNRAYRAGQPTISDAEYDKAVEELRRVDPDNDWFLHIEPATISVRRRTQLPIPMRSLNKAKNMASLQGWAQSIELEASSKVVVTPKFDGLSLLYDERTGMAYSRGGVENEGQDCTAHYAAATQITNAATDLHFTFGEFVFSRASWDKNFDGKIAPETGEKYRAPRNTAAGLLNRDKPSENLKYIDFYRYGTDEESAKIFKNYSEMYKYLCCNYKQPLLYDCIPFGDLTDDYLLDKYAEWSKQYFIDGLVIYADDMSIWSRVGRQITTGNPNYAIAYKHPDFTETFETTVKGITWRVNKSWALKPVVNIETVDVGDCLMENPTGYNAGWVYDRHIAKGAKILVTRSGGVIPKILETTVPAPVEEEDKQWEALCNCPHCHASTKWDKKQIELLCQNPECPGVQLAKIIFFFKTLGAEFVGEETVTKIYNSGYRRIKDILNMTFEDILYIDGFGDSIANQLLSTFAAIKEGVEVTRLMHASDCFNGIGQIKARTILSQLSPENRFLFCSGQMDFWSSNEELQTLPAYINASTTIRSFMQGIIPFQQFVAENELVILPMEEETQATGIKCQNMKVCFTGVRDEKLEDLIRENSGEVVSGVSKKTTHLIVADKNTHSSKAVKAQQIGIPILTIAEFKEQCHL